MTVYFNNQNMRGYIFFGIGAVAVGSLLYQGYTWFAKNGEASEDIPNITQKLASGQVQSVDLPISQENQYHENMDSLAISANQHTLAVRVKQVYKRRLFVGEGDFSYTKALLEKHKETHPNLGCWIIATDLKDFSKDSSEVKRIATENRIQWLQVQRVTVLFDIDSQEIHRQFEGERFKRIQWNCPFGNGIDQKAFRTVIPAFFRACSHLQQLGDRVHITLIQDEKDWMLRQKQNPIVLGSSSAGYRLIKKRVFDQNRYPAYQHVKTNGKKYPKQTSKREFVFEKTGLEGGYSLEKAQELMDPEKKHYNIQTDRQKRAESLEHYCFNCSTDEDSSSSYEDFVV